MPVTSSRYTQVTQQVGYTPWTNISGAVDGVDDTFAETTLSGVFDGYSYFDAGNSLYFTDHTMSSGTIFINRVDIGVTCKAEVSNSENFRALEIVPYFTTPLYEYGQYIYPSTSNNTHWVNVSSLKSTWTWDDVLNLKVDVYGVLFTTLSGTTWDLFVDEVYIKVWSGYTYTLCGLECFDADGNKTLSNTDNISRVIWQKVVESESDGEEAVLTPPGDTLLTFNQVVDDSNGFPHKTTTTVSGNYTIVKWYAQSPPYSDANPSAKTLITLVGF